MTAPPCPHWCTYCALAGDLPAAARELHRSNPMPVDLPLIYGDRASVWLELRQQISGHPTEPVLALWRAGDDRAMLLPLDTARVALAAVVNLLGQADREIVLEAAEQHAALRAQAVTEVRRGGSDAS